MSERWITCEVAAARMNLGVDYFRARFCPREDDPGFFSWRQVTYPSGRRRIEIQDEDFTAWLKSLERVPTIQRDTA